ncbi:UrcA family protein [Sphingomonas trueperi]|uniref:UrcA family protein n=1 Tax=Sphingomonas trueperi TaxID=53317 RepID=UPI000EAF0506
MKMLVAAAAALSISTAAFAAPSDTGFGQPSATLTLAGLDLTTADGQQRLATRVDQAARAVCGENLATIHPDVEARARLCRADVAEQVRSQIEARVAQVNKARGVQVAALR